MSIGLRVNGRAVTVEAALATPLLHLLRNDLLLNGAKYGCGAGQCDAYKVLLEGKDVPSCIDPLIDRTGEEYRGVGEATQGPGGAVVSNAVAKLRALRFRTLPLRTADSLGRG